MTTSYFPFNPSNTAAPTYQVVLDGAAHTLIVKWSLFGQRYYLYCYDQTGVLVFTVPVVASVRGVTIQSLSWDAATLRATATCPVHKLALGTIVQLTVADCAPVGYNGAFDASIITPNSFTYSLAEDPGSLQTVGTYAYLVSLSKGYFTSTIVFRSGQFEVSP